jgi:hypothetical protein
LIDAGRTLFEKKEAMAIATSVDTSAARRMYMFVRFSAVLSIALCRLSMESMKESDRPSQIAPIT